MASQRPPMSMSGAPSPRPMVKPQIPMHAPMIPQVHPPVQPMANPQNIKALPTLPKFNKLKNYFKKPGAV